MRPYNCKVIQNLTNHTNYIMKHLLVLVILLTQVAFISAQDKPDKKGDKEKKEKVYSDIITDEAVSSKGLFSTCLLYTSPSPRDKRQSRMPSSA